MPPTADHPSDAVLRAYASGRLPPEVASSLDGHVAACDRCGEKLATVEGDTWADLLREPATEIQVVTPATAPRPEVPPELRDHPRYDLKDCLGRGGMGVVYLATHRIMRRPVALKLIRGDLVASPEAVERFRREVRAAATLSHPNIVAAYDAEEVAGAHVFVMEYVDGKTLDAIVKKKGPLAVPVACALARQVAQGLDHAHARGMVHRDVKPLNLIVADRSKVKILDFGLARWRPEGDAEHPTREGQALGTMLYSAPEQRQSAKEVDARADQFGLGATLVFLLTGDHPLAGPELPHTIPEVLRGLVARLMAPDPADRFPSMKAVAEALAPWAINRAPVVEPESPFSWPWWLVLALFVFLAVGCVWYATRGRTQTEPTRTEPTTPTPALTGPWRSLLVGEPAAVAGEWRANRGEWRVWPALGARAAIKTAVPAEYDLRVSFTRHSGEHSVGVIVVHNGQQVVFELDSWERHLGGFQNINGESLERNETRHDDVRLENERKYTIVVEVRRDGLRGTLDGREIATLKTAGKELSVDQRFWAMPDTTTLGLVAWHSTVTFHEVEMRGR